MSDERKADERKIGYAISHQFVLDRETSEMVQTTYNVHEGATPAELVEKMRTVSIACWTAQLANNVRVMERTQMLRAEQARRIHEARAAKLKLDDRAIAEQERQMNTSLIRVESEVAADQISLEREQGLTTEQLLERLKTVETATFRATTH